MPDLWRERKHWLYSNHPNIRQCGVCKFVRHYGAFEAFIPTLFDRITASPEVLAEKFIFKEWHPIARCYVWYSLLFDGEERLIYAPAFATKEEAIAATVERLKEVEK